MTRYLEHVDVTSREPKGTVQQACGSTIRNSDLKGWGCDSVQSTGLEDQALSSTPSPPKAWGGEGSGKIPEAAVSRF